VAAAAPAAGRPGGVGPAGRRAGRAWSLRHLTRLVEIAELPSPRWPESVAAWQEEIDRAAPPGAKLLLPMRKLPQAFLRQRARLRCAAVACAAERYRQAEGRWPDRLADLVPTYAADLPPGPYDGGPLRYARRDGGVVVYAVGPDGLDNGGKLEEEGPARGGADVGVRLWGAERRGRPAPR
jgi:hypothetical protein